MDRGDWNAARALLRRARALLPDGSDERAALAPEFALALQEVGENDEAIAATAEAAAARDPLIRARGSIAHADAVGFGGHDRPGEDYGAQLAEAFAVLEAAGDELGLAQYWRLRGYEYWAVLQAANAREIWERALEHAIRAGARRLEVELRNYVMSAVLLGPTPVSEALPYAQRALEEAAPLSLRAASALRALATLSGCERRLDEARSYHEQGRAIVIEAGQHVTASGWTMGAAEIEWRAGDIAAQERVLREGVETLDALGDRFFYPTVALRLADCLVQTREPDDAEVVELCARARERSLPSDLVNFIYLDALEGRRLAYEGSHAAGVEQARRAIETVETTDNFDVRSTVWASLAETLLQAGEPEEAAQAAATSIEIRSAKGDVAGTAALERRFAELGVQPA